MQHHGYSFSSTDCDRKWRSLLKTYRRHLDYSKKTGRSGGKKWVYYNDIDNIVGSSASSVSISVAAIPIPKKETCSVITADGESSCAVETPKKKLKQSQAPEWFDKFVTEFRDDQAKRHKDFMDHLKCTEAMQAERTNLLKSLVEKLTDNK